MVTDSSWNAINWFAKSTSIQHQVPTYYIRQRKRHHVNVGGYLKFERIFGIQPDAEKIYFWG